MWHSEDCCQNRRHIAEHIQALDPKKPALRDLCAAYGYTPLPGTLAVDIRAEIIRLLTDATRPYDLANMGGPLLCNNAQKVVVVC